MPCSTRSKNPSTNAPVEAPAAKRGPGRKRKADEPASATAAANQGLSAAPSDTSKSVSKKKRTLAAQSSNTAQGTATFVDPPNQDLPRPPSPIPSNIPEPMAIDAEPQAGPVALPPTAQAPVSATEESMEPGSEDQGSSTPANAPGDNTRNRNQRAPGLREENAALSKANEELEAKLKQMTGDLRTLKKFKVLWIKEYAKKSQPNVPVPSTSLIPRPPGEKGKNGWNLQEALGLKDNEALYSEMLRYVRHCISRSGLDWESTYSEQEPARLAACFKELKKEHPYLERFQGDWPGKEMVISALQNRRKVLNAKAKAKIASDEKAQAELNAAAATLESGDRKSVV